jgi:hypothetical protein
MGWDADTWHNSIDSGVLDCICMLRQLMTTKEGIDFLSSADTWRLEGCECGQVSLPSSHVGRIEAMALYRQQPQLFVSVGGCMGTSIMPADGGCWINWIPGRGETKCATHNTHIELNWDGVLAGLALRAKGVRRCRFSID